MHLGWSWASAIVLLTAFLETMNLLLASSLSLFSWMVLLVTQLGMSHVFADQQLSRLPLGQHVQNLCTSPLLVQMHHCTEELRICWTILSGTLLLWQHLQAYSSQVWVYWRVSLWWFLGCRESRCWQSIGQSLIQQYCTLCSSFKILTTCCLSECGPADVSTPLDAWTFTDDILVEKISYGLDEVCVLHTSSPVSHRCYL